MVDIINKIIETSNYSIEDIIRSKGKNYTPLNPVSYLEARKNREAFRDIDGILVDGSILVLYIHIFYRVKVERISVDMTSLIPPLFNYISLNNKTAYFIGSKQHEIESSIAIFRQKYPLLKIIGYRNGYFLSENDKNEEYNNIINLNPDFVVVGMGIIHQEEFLSELRQKGFKGTGFTCGGFISQTANNPYKIDYYPKLFDSLNIRFLYRIYKEKHTRKRYFRTIFLFPLFFIIDWIFYKYKTSTL